MNDGRETKSKTKKKRKVSLVLLFLCFYTHRQPRQTTETKKDGKKYIKAKHQAEKEP